MCPVVVVLVVVVVSLVQFITNELVSSVQFSPSTFVVGGEHEGRFSRDPFPVFSPGGPCGQF